MPKHYRNQHQPWQPNRQVFMPLPVDLQIVNAMSVKAKTKPAPASQDDREYDATATANEAITNMMIKGRTT